MSLVKELHINFCEPHLSSNFPAGYCYYIRKALPFEYLFSSQPLYRITVLILSVSQSSLICFLGW